ncbi:MAG: C40 family peptidase [Bacteroidota bacterium]|nr:C40 family peptidase [Bacteroidota bacterium]
MDFGLILLSVIPVRAEPDNRSEMVNQLLFGELLIKSEAYKNWARIRSVYDHYEGWVDQKQITFIDEEEFNRIRNAQAFYSTDPVSVIRDRESGRYTPVLIGSCFPDIKNREFMLNGAAISFEGKFSGGTYSREKLIETAYLYMHSPYLWGGRSPFGIDCSGLIQMIYKINGIAIARDASEQAKQGETLSLMTEARTGDLVFFDDDEGQIIHVGMLLGEDKIIHASGRVRIDSIDHQGIYNRELSKYTHTLRLIKSIV